MAALPPRRRSFRHHDSEFRLRSPHCPSCLEGLRKRYLPLGDHRTTRNLARAISYISTATSIVLLMRSFSRPEQLEQAWWGSWEQVIARRVLASPVVVFVGLGSPASVLLETTKRIVAAVGKPHVAVYVRRSPQRTKIPVSPAHYKLLHKNISEWAGVNS